MPVTTLSSREFNQDTSRAKKAASNGPVFITDRGKPAHVLISIEEYRRLSSEKSKSMTLLEFMDSIPGGDFEFEPQRLRDDMGLKTPDFDD